MKRISFPFIALVIAFVALPVGASSLVVNYMSASFDADTVEGQRFFAYGSGTDHLYDDDAGFDLGTLTGDAKVTGGAIQLGSGGSDWWDATWQRRHCFEVSAETSLTSYPIHLGADTTGLAADDVRVVALGASTPIPHYMESGRGTDFTSVWINQPIGPTAITYCVYFDAEPAQPSTGLTDESSIFVYAPATTVNYYVLGDAYDGSLNAAGSLDVISYTDDTVVTHGTDTATVNAGSIERFTGVDGSSVFTATGPIDGSYNLTNKTELIPESQAASSFTFPTNRNTQSFWIRSPFGVVDVEAVSNGAVIDTVTVGPGDGSVNVAAQPAPDGGYITLRSSAATPIDFLAAHETTVNYDYFPGVPWFGDDLYGVGSTRVYIGGPTATTFDYRRQTGATGSGAVSLSAITRFTGLPSRGDGEAFAIEPNGSALAAIQQADSNGHESTSFFPQRMLSRTYRFPIDYTYITVACPRPGMTLWFNGVASTCNGSGVGGYRTAFATAPAGMLLEADEPIYAYYESASGSDERNLYGYKGFTPYAGDVVATPSAVEVAGTNLCAEWTSDTFTIDGVMGLSWLETSLAPTGSISYLISFDGGAFAGPDGTAATSFHSTEPVGVSDGTSWLPFNTDSATTAQIHVSFCGAEGDEISRIGFESDLAEVFNADSLSASGPTMLLRAYASSPSATQRVHHNTSSGQTDYRLRVDVGGLADDGTQIQATTGTVTNPATPYTADRYNVLLDSATTQNAQLTFTVVHEEMVRLETSFDLSITIP